MPSIHSEELALQHGRECWHEVLVNRYFLEENQEAQVSVCKPMTEWTGTDYGQWAQALWDKLPNSPVIRRHPFLLLCDLAEWYCFGNEAGQDTEYREKG
jgi:hypothetical protein